MTALVRWWTAPMPLRRLAVIRVAAGSFAVGYLVIRAPHFIALADLPVHRFDPVGVLAWMDSPLPRSAMAFGLVLAVGLGVGFVLGRPWRLVGPGFAIAFLLLTSYRNGFEVVLHTEQLVTLHLLVLGVAPAPGRLGEHDAHTWWAGWVIRTMAVLTVATYVVTGFAKLQQSGIEWITGDTLRNHIAYDNLRKLQLGDFYSPLGAWATHFDWLFPPMAAATIAVELSAPVALAGRRLAAWWSAAAWTFHLGVLVLMAIGFPYQLLGVAFLPFLRAEQIVDRLSRRRRAASAVP